jgi:hypothetical protein
LLDVASVVALQSPRSDVIAEAAFIARFSQCAGDLLGNALPLRFNFWVKLRTGRFCSTPSSEHASSPTPAMPKEQHCLCGIVEN